MKPRLTSKSVDVLKKGGAEAFQISIVESKSTKAYNNVVRIYRLKA